MSSAGGARLTFQGAVPNAQRGQTLAVNRLKSERVLAYAADWI